MEKTPLSVSTDKIAIVAMRCGVLLEGLARKCGPEPANRSGTGLVCEVYPDPALRYLTADHIRSLRPRETYKGAARAQRRRDLIGIVQERLRIEDPLGLLELNSDDDHAIDALVGGLVARAAWLSQTAAPIDSDRIEREGWTHLPNAPLSALLQPS
jgi:hypothetical protein